MKKLRVVQMLFTMLVFAGIVFFGCNYSVEIPAGSSSSGGDEPPVVEPPEIEPPSQGGAVSSSSPNVTPSSSANTTVTPSSSATVAPPSSAVAPSSAARSSSSAATSGNTGNCRAAPLAAVPANPQTACISIDGKCYKCNSERNANECAQDWLWTGQSVAQQVTQAYWFTEINCGSGGGTTSSQSTGGAASSSSRASSSSVSTGGGSSYPTLVSGGQGVKSGWASRYWDGCKPSCGWQNNINQGLGGAPVKTCSNDGTSVLSDVNAKNSCESGGISYTCFNQAPWVEGDVAYAFAASHTNSDCGRCYQVQFDGTSKDPSPGETLNHIKGKTLIIKVSNIGGDVGGTQFDLMIPGGGVGNFDSFSGQSGVNSGAITGSTRYGGLVTDCHNQYPNGSLSQLQTCLNGKCDAAFTNADLKSGCKVYASWFGVVNNPNFLTKEITCPSQLNGKW